MNDLFTILDKSDIKNLIRRRRGQMLVHSYLYYWMDSPIISDDQWQAWADELETLQRDNPDCLTIGYYDKEFSDWTGATGAHLPNNVYIINLSRQLLAQHEVKKSA